MTLSSRATCTASFMSCTGRTGARAADDVSCCCVGRLIIRNNSAAITKLTASARNAALRPYAAANTPPIAAPRASITPHVLPVMEFAMRRSSSLSTRFGIAAEVAGPTNDASAAMMPWNRKAVHTLPASTVRRPRAATAWANDTMTRILRRSNLSTDGPATGDMRNDGKVNDTMTTDTRNLESVRSCTSPERATIVNQSPR